MPKEKKLERAIKDTGLVLRAAWGAATGEVDPRYIAGYTRALREIRGTSFCQATEVNLPENRLRDEMLKLSTDAMQRNGWSNFDIFSLPWLQTRINANRLAAYLMAFTNNHGRETTEEFFPVDKVMNYLSAIQGKFTEAEKAGIPEQYSLALECANDNPLAAAILCHSAFRAIARGADTRISENFLFLPEEQEGISINKIASRTKDFVGQITADPLGNTYHFWSQFTAFSVFCCGENEFPKCSRLYRTLFNNGPRITQFVRSGIMGKNQQFGLHEEVDMQGMRIGRSVGRRLTKYMEDADGSRELSGTRQSVLAMPLPRSW